MEAKLQAEIKKIMAKGDRSVRAAKLLKKASQFDFAVSRAYYAMFYYATAVLLTKGLSFSTHKGLISGFGAHFVKPGTFPRDLAKKLSVAFRHRNISDYEFGYEVVEEIAKQTIEDAEVFIKVVKNYLKQVMKETKS